MAAHGIRRNHRWFPALKAPDFDPMNVNARGLERLRELTDALMSVSEPQRAIPELFHVMERLPDADLGSPGPLVHTLEAVKGYEDELIRSVRRSPSLLSVWMVNRILIPIYQATCANLIWCYLMKQQLAQICRKLFETMRGISWNSKRASTGKSCSCCNILSLKISRARDF
jgi:hypothetical protein